MVADALVNIVLFVPLGAALATCRRSAVGILTSALVLSAAIESVQLALPGRQSSLADVIFNTAGAGAGLLLARLAPRLLRAEGRWAARLSLAASCLAAGATLLAGQLLAPSLPRSRYEARWTPTARVEDPYRGTVLQAQVAGRSVRDDLDGSASVRADLLRGGAFRIVLLAGPPTSRMAPIVGIYDEDDRQIAIVGADGSSLVFRYRTRAASWQLDQPDVVLVDALAGVEVGDTVTIDVHRRPRGWRVLVNGEQEKVGFTVGHAWAVLLYGPGFPPRVQSLLGALWIAAVFVPIGYWARFRWESLVALILAMVAVGVLPMAGDLMPTPAIEIISAPTGFGIGFFFRQLNA